MIIENHNANFEDVKKFLRVAGITGVLFIKRATVSAVMGGCPEEIEVSSAMAASAWTAVMGESLAQVIMASEIVMEHYLGLTCDPIGGLA